MSESTEPVPPGWGDDQLSTYMRQAYLNRYASFVRKPEFQRLIKLDQCFARIVENWHNPEDQLGTVFFIRSHAAFRAACEHTAATQIADSYPLIRACLEYAAYALYLCKNPDLIMTWLNRNESDDNKKAVRKEFTFARIRSAIAKVDPKLAYTFQELYERTVDLGAHPNQMGVFSSMEIFEEQDRLIFNTLYMNCDGVILDYAMRTTAQAAVCALSILKEIFPERFKLTGVGDDLIVIRRGL